MEIFIAILGTILLPASIFFFEKTRRDKLESEKNHKLLMGLELSMGYLNKNNQDHFDLLLQRIKDLASREETAGDVLNNRLDHIDALVDQVFTESRLSKNEIESLKKEFYAYRDTMREALNFLNEGK